jgi:4-methylaminobutanoate oxidase (formaldehyde-forming)
VVIVGGGIIGTSVAYHLAKLGVSGIVLLERHQLTAGTTWHAAGLINTFGSLSTTSTAMRMYTKDLYARILPQETGLDTGFRDVGFIELATDADHLHYYRRVAALNRYCGVEVQELTANEVKDKCPILQTEDVLAGFYVATDGRVNPHEATMALARGSKDLGVDIYQGIGVREIVTSRVESGLLPKVTSVITEDDREIECSIVVNCAGMWARQLAEQNNVIVPNQAAEHYYLLTDAIPKIDPGWPVVEDSANCVYVRPEGEGLMLGLFEWEGASWNSDKIPHDFLFGELNPDWDRMLPYLQKAIEKRIAPEIGSSMGAKKLFCGPESFTPDNAPIVGPAPFLENYFVAAGLNSIGILTGGGIGRIIAHWINNKGVTPSDWDVTYMRPNRFLSYQNNPMYRAKRVVEALGNTYKIPYPDRQLRTCRNCLQSPLQSRLQQQGAHFRDVSGWESPAWYHVETENSGTDECESEYTFSRPRWFDYWKQEHESCRSHVALFDMSFMSKFLVSGRDAGSFLNRLSTADVDGDCNKITYTQWLNEAGYMEADLTVTKLAQDEFMVVATDTMRHHVHSHMMKRLSPKMHCFVTDLTARYAQINLQGPVSRRLMTPLTSRDMKVDFDFRHAEEIDLGLARVLCVRITYVGELGYELFIPVEQARYVYDQIVAIGKDLGLRHAGLRALGSLRLEKGYRDYGHDMDNTDRILECGLGFTCDFSKPEGFIGQNHVEALMDESQQRGGLFKRMANILVEDAEPMLHHGEILWRSGQRISEIRMASYGHTLGGAVGLSMLENDNPITKTWIRDGFWEVEVSGKLYPCSVSLIPFYDPKNLRIKI